MESSPAPPASRPDALDELEALAIGWLRGQRTPSAEALLTAIDQVEQDGRLYAQPPPIDPSEGRHSSAELRCLVEALASPAKSAPGEKLQGRSRAGYLLEGDPAREARVLPAFAAALGRSEKKLREEFPDLWALDARLWEALPSAEPRALAILWLESPGRRLVQDLRALRNLPREAALGASDLSLDRILAAAAPCEERKHRELHRAVPGKAMEDWEPRPENKDEQVLRALRLLEEGSPIGLRGAALAWLLDRAVKEPFYAVGSLRRDLRDELPLRLGAALPTWRDERAIIARKLERLTLQHAARIVATASPDKAAPQGFAIARWLQGCLRRSPFFGADEEVLAAHLEASLPAEPTRLLEDADALHPARFATDDDGLDVAEIALLSGVLAHYLRPPEETLLPTPVPLVEALQAIAGRPVREAEIEADEALAAGRNALGWPEGYSLAAPLAARRLMTELRIGWIAKVSESAQRDAIERFAADPRGNAWLAFALNREGQHLAPEARARAAEVFRALAKGMLASDARAEDQVEAHVIGTFGAGLLEALTDDDMPQILATAARSDSVWRPFVLDALAGAAERIERGPVFQRALDALLALMEDRALDEKARLNAALFAMRRASASKLPGRDALLGRIAAAAVAPPFTDHLGLRREIRRLGLAAPVAAGSKR